MFNVGYVCLDDLSAFVYTLLSHVISPHQSALTAMHNARWQTRSRILVSYCRFIHICFTSLHSMHGIYHFHHSLPYICMREI